MNVQVYLPLLERNSIAGKVLYVTYSLVYEYERNGEKNSGKKVVHLVFDAGTEKYREETKHYHNSVDENGWRFDVRKWDGKEYLSWDRHIDNELGFRALGNGIYEDPGSARIDVSPTLRMVRTKEGEATGIELPEFAKIFYTPWPTYIPFDKVGFILDSKVGDIDADTITLEAESYTFQISKKNGALKRLIFHWSPGADGKRFVVETVDFSNHLECAGVWIPLRITRNNYEPENTIKEEYFVDPTTLRLLDVVEDSSIFNILLPAGCGVFDKIRKNFYTVTTADTLPADVNALKQVLDKMLEQAQEQKEEAAREK